jgi:hypothetical protein
MLFTPAKFVNSWGFYFDTGSGDLRTYSILQQVISFSCHWHNYCVLTDKTEKQFQSNMSVSLEVEAQVWQQMELQ